VAKANIDIVGRDFTGSAFGKVNKSLGGLNSSVSSLAGNLGTLGVAVSAAGFVALIKNASAAQDAIAKMSQATGVGVETLAGLDFAATQSGTNLDQVAKGMRRFSRLILESADGTDKYGRIVRALGLDLDKLKESTPDEQFIQLAGAIRENVSEQERAVVVTSLFGNEYAKLTPLLAQGEEGLRQLIEEGKKLNPVTAESAAQAELFNDNLDKLGRTAGALGTTLFNAVSPALTQVTEDLLKLSELSFSLDSIWDDLGNAFNTVLEIATPGFAFTDKTREIQALAGATEELKEEGEKSEKVFKSFQKELDAINKVTKTSTSVTKESVEAKAELRAETERLKNEERERAQTMAEIERITRSVETAEQRVAREVKDLNDLLKTGKLDWNVYSLAVKEAEASLEDVGDKAEETEEELDQFSIQAARDMQSAFGTIFFDAFEGRTDGIVDTFTSAIKRMASEALAADLLGAIFNTGGGNVSGLLSAFGGGGAASGGLFSSFGSAGGLSGILGGGTATQGISGGAGNVFGSLPGLLQSGGGGGVGLGSFILPGIAGAALGLGIGKGIAGDKEIFGASGSLTSTIGSGIGTGIGGLFGGPAGAAIGGAAGGVIAGAITSLFGRGPFKAQETRLLGDFDNQGFTGATNIRAVSKGGAFRSNKTDNILNDTDTGELLNAFKGIRESGIASELQGLAANAAETAQVIGGVLDSSIVGMDATLRNAAESLNLSTFGIDRFSATLDIASAKGEELSEAQIAEAIGGISDQFAQRLIPEIESLSRGAESGVDTVARLVLEFDTLEAAMVAFGVSSDVAANALQELTFAQRTALVDAAGGIEALNQEVSFFVQNFLTDEEQLKIAFDSLDAEMKKLGFSADITREEFRAIVESLLEAGGVSVETAAAMLQLAPSFVAVKNAGEALARSNIDLANSSITAANANTAAANANINSANANAQAANITAAAAEAQRNAIQSSRVAISNAESDQAARENIARLRERVAGAQANAVQVSNDAFESSPAQVAQRNNAQREAKVADNSRRDLISSYRQEASALKSVADKFSNLAINLDQFRDTLDTSSLSPLTPKQQLDSARQLFNSVRGLAQGGDADALARLPDVSRSFLEASQKFNASNDVFQSDFNLVKNVLESAANIATNEANIAQSQLNATERVIKQLEAEEDALSNINSSVNGLNVGLDTGFNNVGSGLGGVDFSVQGVSANLGVVDASVIAVEGAVLELTRAVLQGPGNPAITAEQIRAANNNPNNSIQDLVNLAVENGVSAEQFAAATGVSITDINRAVQGLSVSDDDIRGYVFAPGRTAMEIYQGAVANGISSERLMQTTGITADEINSFLRENNLAAFERGSDFIPRTGLAMLHKGEAVVPSSTTREISLLREELSQLRREQNAQTNALINTNIEAQRENARLVSKANADMQNFENFKRRTVASIR